MDLACNKLGVGMLVVTIWLEHCTFYSCSCRHSPPRPSSLALIKSRMETWWYQLTHVHLENGLNGKRDFKSNNSAVKGAAVTQVVWVLFQMRTTKSLLVNIRQGIWLKLLQWRLVTLAFSAPYKCCYLLTYLLCLSPQTGNSTTSKGAVFLAVSELLWLCVSS